MPKKSYALAVLAIVLIPGLVVLAGALQAFINPEWAQGTADYGRNFRLISLAKNFLFMAGGFAVLGLWCTACFLIVVSKRQSWWWLVATPFGPFGLMVLCWLAELAPEPGDWHANFVARLKMYQRIAYELVVCIAIWNAASWAIDIKRDLMIWYQSQTRGVPIADIIKEQAASSGMWAFGEMLETLYLVAALYLVRPLIFNFVEWSLRRGARPLPVEKSSADH